jgi:hypothetical protein
LLIAANMRRPISLFAAARRSVQADWRANGFAMPIVGIIVRWCGFEKLGGRRALRPGANGKIGGLVLAEHFMVL